LKKLIVIAFLVGLVACDRGLTERERECMELTGDAQHCIRSSNYVRPMHQPVNYGPTSPGSYTNYYGSPEHGHWQGGQYHFHDPYGHAASSTNSFLLGAGIGGLAAYMLTKDSNRDSWTRNNPSGFTEKKYEVKKYIGKGGKEISQAEYDRRKAQSEKDKAKHKQRMEAKKKAEAARKANEKKRLEAQKAAAAKAKQKPTYDKSKPSYSTPKPSYSKPSYSKPSYSKSKKR